MAVEVVIYMSCRIWRHKSAGSDWSNRITCTRSNDRWALRVPVQLPVPGAPCSQGYRPANNTHWHTVRAGLFLTICEMSTFTVQEVAKVGGSSTRAFNSRCLPSPQA